jgi:hypothetical protein
MGGGEQEGEMLWSTAMKCVLGNGTTSFLLIKVAWYGMASSITHVVGSDRIVL